LQDVRGKEFHIFSAKIRKAREPNAKLFHGTESKVNAWTSWACIHYVVMIYVYSSQRQII